MQTPSDPPIVPLEQAHIVQLEMIDRAFAIVVFSNGDAVKLELEKLRQLVLTSGTEYVSSRDDDND